MNITQININHKYQLAAISMHSVRSSVEIFKRSSFHTSAKEYPIL